MTTVDEQLVELELVEVGPRGDATAFDSEGQPIYVSLGIPGERVLARIHTRGRHSSSATVEQVLRPSPDRVTPPCPLFGTCSGCQLQHVAMARQLEFKRTMVTRQLERFGGFTDAPVAAVIPAPDPWHYRNHARFTVRRGRLGFIRRHRRQFFEVPECLLMDVRINRVVAQLQGRLQETTQCNIRVGRDAGAQAVAPKLSLTDIESGQPTVSEHLLGRDFLVSTASFFQVHRAQAERLIELAREAIVEAGAGVVVDAYAGVGTFAALLADRVASVIAVEESGPAMRDAKVNITGLSNVQLRQGKAEVVLHELAAAGAQVDAVILDPPRSGCLPPALAAVIELAPRVVVYVSCDPATLARDLRVLCDGGYALVGVQPVDMFPQTTHVECVATLRRVQSARDATPSVTADPS